LVPVESVDVVAEVEEAEDGTIDLEVVVAEGLDVLVEEAVYIHFFDADVEAFAESGVVLLTAQSKTYVGYAKHFKFLFIVVGSVRFG
jgi:hypothetical protein